jgi:hypothetical protein
VRYPEQALKSLADWSIDFRGYLSNLCALRKCTPNKNQPARAARFYANGLSGVRPLTYSGAGGGISAGVRPRERR